MFSHIHRFAPFALALELVSTTLFAADGLIALKSPYPAKETMNRFEDTADRKSVV